MKKSENTNSPFNWRSKPSALSESHDFNGVNHQKSMVAAIKVKHSPISLPGGSKYLQPNMMEKPK